MANYKILKQEAEDYDKVMGAYSEAIDNYNAQAEAFNQMPYVTSSNFITGVKLSNGQRGRYVDANGRLKRDADGTRYHQVDKEVQEPVEYDSEGNVTKYSTKVTKVWERAPIPVVPEEPSMQAPNFTRSEANTLQNPPPSLAQATMTAPGRLDKIKELNGMRPEPFLNPEGQGILQRVRAGKL